MVTSPALRRLARKAGITRMADDAIWVTRGALFTFVTHVTRDALAYCDFAQRKTVMVSDVLYALKRQGQTVYGFGL
ncbi:core histone H2A/H2B/H3/H4 [Pelomyxa schiedti]|nr:core histone H2A/H2B/H3/H4 [Pelomyxa schiedti]